MMQQIDAIGQRYGRLVVLGELKWQGETVRYVCRCDCGNGRVADGANIRFGRTQSCGCWQDETRRERATHGHARKGKVSRTFLAWQNMLRRCTDTGHQDYWNYGGRGIKVCNRWQSFETFLTDMGECPPKLTLDRERNDKGYEPGNCRWATRSQQNRNRRPFKTTLKWWLS